MSNDSSQNKTEQPTQRKLERSREKGQIAYSSDLTAGVALLATTLITALLARHLLEKLSLEAATAWSQLPWYPMEKETLVQAVVHMAWQVLGICAPLLAAAFFSTFAMGGLITGYRLTPKAIGFEIAKLNPVQGFKKLFSWRSAVRGGLSIFKLLVIATIVFVLLRPLVDRSDFVWTGSVAQLVQDLVDLSLLLLIGAAAGLVVLGVADFAFQKWKHIDDMKMSRSELQDERKEDEGDPQIRARLKRLQREVSERSLSADIASATVVITNPTHFAVALKYDRTLPAPVVVAKGQDFLALRIMEIARQQRKPVVQRKPLARALYATVAVGQEIPLELYQDVAEVLSYIYSIDRQAG